MMYFEGKKPFWPEGFGNPNLFFDVSNKRLFLPGGLMLDLRKQRHDYVERSLGRRPEIVKQERPRMSLGFADLSEGEVSQLPEMRTGEKGVEIINENQAAEVNWDPANEDQTQGDYYLVPRQRKRRGKK